MNMLRRGIGGMAILTLVTATCVVPHAAAQEAPAEPAPAEPAPAEPAPAPAETDPAEEAPKPDPLAPEVAEIRNQLGQVKAETAELRAQSEKLSKDTEAIKATLGELAAAMKRVEELLAAQQAAMAAKPAEKPAEPAKAAVVYDEHVAPIIQARCAVCHNDDNASGGLSLANHAALMKGGSSGPVITAGDPDASRLYKLIAGLEEPKMPPSGGPLEAAQIDVIREWIQGGAPANAEAAKQMAKMVEAAPDTAAPPPTAAAEGPPPMPEVALAQAKARSAKGIVARAVAVSPHAPLMAVGGDHQVLLYQLDSGELLGALPYDEGDVYTLTFSTNGALLLAGGGQEGASGCTALWDVKTTQRLGTFGSAYDTVLAADISPDHRLIAQGGPNKVVRIYAVENAAELYKVDAHTNWITSVRFSPDGELLATADRAGGLYLWQAANGRPVENLRGHEGAIHDMAYSYDANLLATAGEDGSVQLWDTWKYKRTRKIGAHSGAVLGVHFSRDGELVSSGADGLVKRWAQDGKTLATYEGLGDWGYQARFGLADTLILAGNWQGAVYAWDRASAERKAEFTTQPAG